MPQITVITPVYKTARWLDACVESILAQSFTDFELLLVDDGSPDECPALCDAWAQRDARVRVLHKENGGVQSAVLRGLTEARAPYCAFVDSDDLAAPALLETLHAAMTREDADLVFCGVLELVNGHERPFWAKKNTVHDADALAKALDAFFETHGDLWRFCMAARWNKLYRTQGLREIAFCLAPTQAMGEDLVMNLYYLARCRRAVCVDDVLYLYRAQSSSVMRSFCPERTAQYRQMEAELKKAALALGYKGAALRPRMDGLYAILLYHAILSPLDYKKKLYAMREIYGIIGNKSKIRALAATQPPAGRCALLLASFGRLRLVARVSSRVGRKNKS